jgi:hypothetical protein
MHLFITKPIKKIMHGQCSVTQCTLYYKANEKNDAGVSATSFTHTNKQNLLTDTLFATQTNL